MSEASSNGDVTVIGSNTVSEYNESTPQTNIFDESQHE